MQDKVYQIKINKGHLKRIKDRLNLCVTAHSEYAESKNINQWDDAISMSLADDLFSCFESLEEFLDKVFDSAKEIKINVPEKNS